MTDHRDEPTEAPPEPPAVAPVRRRKPLGWILAAILALVLGVLVLLYYMGIFDGERRREEVPWNAASPPVEAAPTLPDNGLTGNLTNRPPANNAAAVAAPANNMAAAAAPTAQPGRVTAQWLTGDWGEACPGSTRETLVFMPGGRYSGVGGMGNWTLNGNIVTLRINGRSLDMRWDYLTQDSARVTRQRTGQSYTLYRCL